MKKILILFAILIFSGKASADVTINGAGSGSGDITGPSSVTSGSIAAFDGTTGNVLKEATDVERIASSTAFSDGDTTPDVSAAHFFRTANTSPTTITDFDAGAGALTTGWNICIFINDSDTTFDFTSSGLEGIAVDYTASNGETICFIYDSTDTQWHVKTSPEAVEALSINGIVVNSSGTPIAKEFVVIVQAFTTGTTVTTGDSKNCFVIPPLLTGMDLTSIGAHVYTASSSGTPTIQIRNQTDTADMLSTAITIDANEKDSSTAVTAAVINAATDDVVTGDEICIDVDISGTGTAGLEVRFGFNLP